jgi:hypothetical protein
VNIFLTAFFEKNTLTATADTMTLPVMKFQDQGYKIRNILAKKSTHPKEIIEF